MTKESSFQKPDDFSDDGTSFIPSDEIEQRIKSQDTFTSGKSIKLAGENKDESAKQKEYLEDKLFGEDLRDKVKINRKEDNFTVVVECVDSQQNVSLGSGVLATIETQKFDRTCRPIECTDAAMRCILTAAHCIMDKPRGFVQKV